MMFNDGKRICAFSLFYFNPIVLTCCIRCRRPTPSFVAVAVTVVAAHVCREFVSGFVFYFHLTAYPIRAITLPGFVPKASILRCIVVRLTALEEFATGAFVLSRTPTLTSPASTPISSTAALVFVPFARFVAASGPGGRFAVGSVYGGSIFGDFACRFVLAVTRGAE